MARRVVVTGLGLQTPLGRGVAASWAALVAEKSGIRALAAPDVALPGMDPEGAEHIFQQLPSRIAGLVPAGPPGHARSATPPGYTLGAPGHAQGDSSRRASGPRQGQGPTLGTSAAGEEGGTPEEPAVPSEAHAGRQWKQGEQAGQPGRRNSYLEEGQPGEVGLDAHERGLPKFIQFALLAAEEALRDASWHPEDQRELQSTGVAIGGGIGPVHEIAAAGQLVMQQRLRKLTPHFVPRILVNMPAGHVSIKYGFQGPNHASATACASGAHGIGDAFKMVRDGDADVMLAGGTESCIDALSIGGFCRLRALSTSFNDDPQMASRPFDQRRDGFVMAEGAGILVLEELQHALRRSAPRIYAEVRGYGMSGDAHHITHPSPEGTGASLAMKRALLKAGLEPSDISYINAHATSTPLGDAIEARAIASVLGQRHISDSSKFALSSTKGATGHLLGAAGAVEAIFSVLSLHNNMVPVNLNLETPDPLFAKWGFLPNQSTRELDGMNAVLSNSFGFGGTNACLVFARARNL